MSTSEIEMYKQAIDNLNAQLEASKQMYNEALNNTFQIKTAQLLAHKQVIDLNAKVKSLEEQLLALTAKEVTTPDTEEGSTEDASNT